MSMLSAQNLLRLNLPCTDRILFPECVEIQFTESENHFWNLSKPKWATWEITILDLVIYLYNVFYPRKSETYNLSEFYKAACKFYKLTE